MNRYQIVKKTKYGWMVELLGKRGKPLKDQKPFLACPRCFSLKNGGGIMIEPEGYCSNCGYFPGENIE